MNRAGIIDQNYCQFLLAASTRCVDLYRVDWLSTHGLSNVCLSIMHREDNVIHGGQHRAQNVPLLHMLNNQQESCRCITSLLVKMASNVAI